MWLVQYIPKIIKKLIELILPWWWFTPSLTNWLATHPNIANSIKWQFKFETNAYDVPASAKKSWSSWSASEQQDLIKAFEEAWKWYYKQSDPFNNLQETIPYPPVNLSETITDDSLSPQVVVDESYAWQLYIRWISLNLLAEIGKHFSWSIINCNAEELQVLFDSVAFMSRRPDGKYTVCSANPSHPNYVKRKDNLGASLVAPPRYTYAFLVKNNIIGSSRYKTIASLLQWVSNNMVHFYGSDTYGNTEAHWQYRGIPPITRVIEGTTNTVTNEFGHWTAGCHGTAGFLRNVLRAANIPVQVACICCHALPYFMTEGLYLDHSDNPYNSTFKGLGLPTSALLINETTYINWFGANLNNHENNCNYIGHQVDVLASGKTP
jgi:hypothetical protein